MRNAKFAKLKVLSIASVIVLAFQCLSTGNFAEAMEIRNIERLDELKPSFRSKIEILLKWACKEFPGENLTVASTYRTKAQQDALYAKGRHITRAKGGQSAHNFRKACDIYFIKDRKIAPYSDKYERLGKKAVELGLVYGGNWKMRDYGHYEKGKK